MYKTKIDWCDSTWNPVTGCFHDCEYCYARKIANRFALPYAPSLGDPGMEGAAKWDSDEGMDTMLELEKPYKRDGRTCMYPMGFYPTFHRYRLDVPKRWSEPRTIFVCSMADLFGEWVPDEWIDDVIRATQKAYWHRYLFLTKNPERYDHWLSRFEENKIPGLGAVQGYWFGASASNNEELERANRSQAIWLSVEPIREHIYTDEDQFMEFCPTPGGEVEGKRWMWVVIGAETGNSKNKVTPKKEWIDEIAQVCAEYRTPVFMKESLREIMGGDFRQEWPWEAKA